MDKAIELLKYINKAQKIGIVGHVRPDGDCVGSTVGLYTYIKENYPTKEVHVYGEESKESFEFMKYFKAIETEIKDDNFDLFISIDLSDTDRMAVVGEVFAATDNTVNIDHHVSNTRFAKYNHVVPDASSACEVLYDLLDEEKISIDTAYALYTGIIHDSGVFKYSSTSEHTMNIAGKLMNKGIDFPSIIDGSFYEKTYVQNQILGRALLESIIALEGNCIFSKISKKEMDFYGVDQKQMGGIVEQLRLTKGVDVAIFLYELEPMEYKVSLRSKKIVDCNKVAGFFGGGGHVRAAGAAMKGSYHDVISNLLLHVQEQLVEAGVIKTEENIDSIGE